MQLKTLNPTNQLTPRQLQSLKAVAGFQTSRCYSPTIAELASELGISRSTAFEHIGELRKKNLLSACPGKARSLKLTSKAQKLLNHLTTHSSNSYPQPPGGIPFVGRVAAGSPIEAIENMDQLSLSSHFGSSDCLFALEVTGNSMVDDDIRNGDYVICRRSCVADTGQLVIAVVDKREATLKRFYKEKSSVRLQPANDDYAPIYSDNCRIEAVVVGLVRKL
ncbi:MAG TPA: repressor LexA [Phycisphaerales bacterium]|nr:repressor LexA [Phycisphaerales bacterium]